MELELELNKYSNTPELHYSDFAVVCFAFGMPQAKW